MNKQFENLMYHAGLTASGCWDQMDSYDHTAIEKFAQLIVQECAGIADTAEPFLASDLIKQHFGVKE
jgi:hypothetical protein